MSKDDAGKKPALPFSYKPNPPRKFPVPSSNSASSSEQKQQPPSRPKALWNTTASGSTNPSQFLASLDRISKGNPPLVSIKVEDTGEDPLISRRSIEKRPAKQHNIDLPKKKSVSSKLFTDAQPFLVPKRPTPEPLRFKTPERPLQDRPSPAPQSHSSNLFTHHSRDEHPILERTHTESDAAYRPDTPLPPCYNPNPVYGLDRKLVVGQQSEPSCPTAQTNEPYPHTVPSFIDAPLLDIFTEEEQQDVSYTSRQTSSAPSSQQPIRTAPRTSTVRRSEMLLTDDDAIDKLADACKEKLTKKSQAYSEAQNKIQSLETTVNEQQRAIQDAESRLNDMSRWIQTMTSRQQRFDQSVMSLRGRYDAFHSVMGDLEKFASVCHQTKVANAKAFEDFEQRYCNTLREQLDALTEKSEELNSSFMMLQSEHEDIKKLAQQLATECETYRPTLDKIETQCRSHMNTIEATKDQTSQIHKQLANSRSTLIQLKEESAVSKQTYQDLRDKWSQMEVAVIELEKALTGGADYGAHEPLYSRLESTVNMHTEACKHYEKTICDLKEELKSAKGDFASTTARYEDEIQQLKSEKLALMHDSCALTEELSYEKERYIRLEDEAKKQQSALSTVRSHSTNSQGSTKSAAAHVKSSTNNKRTNPESTESSLPKVGTTSMTLRSSCQQSKMKQKVKQEQYVPSDDFQADEPLKKRPKRTLLRKKPPPDISVDPDNTDPEKEIQAYIASASIDPYQTNTDSINDKSK